jgi:superfamily II DNA/RNA helicase
VIPAITDALEAVGITTPFPIQELTLPIALTGTDVIGQARTGTGKTLAFGIPLLQRLVAPRDPDFTDLAAAGRPQALVVVPTRELAIQVTGDLSLAGSRRDVRVVSIYGGRAYEPQLAALRRGVEVVVGTPGRLLDLVAQGRLDLGHVKSLVLDEADRMLDLGFLPDVERLVQLTPESRQSMLFSATMPGAVLALARRYLRQPTNIRAESPHEVSTVPTTEQHVFRAHPMDKAELLARVLQAEGRGLAMIFCRTKRQAQQVADDLADRGFAVAAVHGDLGQGAREQALRAFRTGKIDVLVATDVAARGIDVEGVTHVINYQCPEDDKDYLHRIGRTGRAGAPGVAVTLVGWDELTRWQLIDKALGLGLGDPAETYSTSAHLYEQLGVPADAQGALPRAQRTRVGLAAEALEDLGETGRSRRRRTPDRRGASADPPAVRLTGSTRPTRPTRQRRRTRAGQPQDASQQQAAAASGASAVTGGSGSGASGRAAGAAGGGASAVTGRSGSGATSGAPAVSGARRRTRGTARKSA